jgi:chitinase
MRRHSWATALFQIGAIWSAPGVAAVDSAAATSAARAYLANSPFTVIQAPASTATTDAAALRAAVIAGNHTSRISPETRRRCPRSCSSSGANPNDWYMYHSVNRLGACDSTMLLHFALYNDLDDPKSRTSIASCTADLEASDELTSALTATTSACQRPTVNQIQVTSSLQLASSGSSSSTSISSAVDAMNQLQVYLNITSEANCDEIIEFAYSGQVAIGVYVGSALATQGIITSVLGQLSNQVQTNGLAENTLVQLCDDRPSRYSLGIFVNTNADLSSVQRGVQSWRNGSCVSSMDETTVWQNVSFSVPSTLNSNATKLHTRNHQLITSRDDTCSTVEVVYGDTCTTLVEECGITSTEFYEYNTASDLCSTLAVGQKICCSSGGLPDNSPTEDSDGYCYSYTVASGDTCSSIAAAYDITADDISNYNNDTWGWSGCNDLIIGESSLIIFNP